MKLENQVCTLSQAKKLKHLGVKQDSLFCFVGNETLECPYSLYLTDDAYSNVSGFYFETRVAAFTVAELGQMLPEYILADFEFPEKWSNYRSGQYECSLEIWKCNSSITGYGIAYRKNNNPNIQLPKSNQAFFKEHEAEVRAEMLIYLLENVHVKVAELNSELCPEGSL